MLQITTTGHTEYGFWCFIIRRTLHVAIEYGGHGGLISSTLAFCIFSHSRCNQFWSIRVKVDGIYKVTVP